MTKSGLCANSIQNRDENGRGVFFHQYAILLLTWPIWLSWFISNVLNWFNWLSWGATTAIGFSSCGVRVRLACSLYTVYGGRTAF